MRVHFLHLGREHMGIELLSAMLKRSGHQVSVGIDPGLFGPEDNVFYIPKLERLFKRNDKLLRDVLSAPPDLLAFSPYTSTVQWALELAREVKRHRDIPTVFGGPHATLVPEFLVERPEVDYLNRGEGEGAIVDLANALDRGGDVGDIANLSYMGEDGRPVHNPLRPLVDLDSLPLPDKALFRRYSSPTLSYLIAASRGCVNRCTYCCEGTVADMYNRRFYRLRSVGNVLAELDWAKTNWRSREVLFVDTILHAKRSWALELLAGYGDTVGIPFRCFGSTNLMDEQIARALKQAGCFTVQFGLQTVNDKLRSEILGRRDELDESLAVFRLCDRMGLWYDVDIMFNLPGETLDDYRRTIEAFKGLKRLNRIKCHYLTLFPGTPLLETEHKSGKISDEQRAAVESGFINDFFHEPAIENPERSRQVRATTRTLKILTLMPDRYIDRVLRDDKWLSFANLPYPLLIALQLLNALRGRDHRFWTYIKYYVQQVPRALYRSIRDRRIAAVRPVEAAAGRRR